MEITEICYVIEIAWFVRLYVEIIHELYVNEWIISRTCGQTMVKFSVDIAHHEIVRAKVGKGGITRAKVCPSIKQFGSFVEISLII